MIWRCPRCRGVLVETDGGLRCETCSSRYESVAGIPDLRLPGPSWIDCEADTARARHLLDEKANLSTEELVRYQFISRPDWTEKWGELRTRQTMEGPQRFRSDLRGWLHPCMTSDGIFFDLGCGSGGLLASAAAEGRNGIGIDVSMTWLVVARRLILESGGQPVLAAALAEALPLADDSVSCVVSLDVIEHVGDPGPYLSEISRVTKSGGYVALATPNRYSLTAEPHVFVWGVGWLPRSVQKRFVKWRCGKSYDFVRLLSPRELARLMSRHTRFQFDILIPPVPREEIALFPTYRATLAKWYNRLVRLRWTHWVFSLIGPFFHILGKKVEPGERIP